MAITELERIKLLDSASIKDQSVQLVAVDEMIAGGELASAKTKLAEAAALSGKSLSRSNRRSSSGPSSYVAALNLKLNERFAAEAEKEKAEAEAAASKALAENLRKSDEDEDVEGAEEEMDKDEKNSTSFAFNALSGANTDKLAKESEEKPKSSSSIEREERPQPAAIEDEGGFSFGLLVPILTGVLIVVVVLLKALGIGGSKNSD